MIPGHLRVDLAEALANKCPVCEEWLLEAWERMTDGGCGFHAVGSQKYVLHPRTHKVPFGRSWCMVVDVPERALVAR